jgi:ATP-dependent DNA helicase RecG
MTSTASTASATSLTSTASATRTKAPARARKPTGALPAAAPVAALRGVGAARAAALARLGLATVRDVLLYAPRGFEPAARRLPIGAACALRGVRVEVAGTVTALRLVRAGRGRSQVRARVEDASGSLEALWFNQPWRRRQIAIGQELVLRGPVVGARAAGLAMPQVGTAAKPLAAEPELLPRYAVGAGIGQEWLRKLVEQARERLATELEEPLDAHLRERARVPSLAALPVELHAPSDANRAAASRRRIALEALLGMQARLVTAARARGPLGAPVLAASRAFERAFRRALPFEPTRDQQRAFDVLAAELVAGRPLRRLLQGDVGCGKTAVLAYACARAVTSGAQAAFLAPTELLAEQHWIGTRALFAALGVEAALLTGSTPPHERTALVARLARGAPLVVFGTHALLGAAIRFAKLALVAIDEQQRFGVAQRQRLLDKGIHAHLLLATATPIPRTLALSLYGELEPLLLRDKPAGRGALRTKLVTRPELAQLEPRLCERLADGERAYWILPRIDTSAGGRGAEEAAATLARGPLARHGIGLLHGRIDALERARTFERFQRGEIRLLVGTSLLEVGLDVPQATCIAIEGAERFGLAQLHQLRGRVGRGPRDSWCFVAAGEGADAAARERLDVFARESDGFKIAELDLALRGMGELVGLKQAGASREGLSGAGVDLELWQLAREWITSDDALRERYLAGGRAAPIA